MPPASAPVGEAFPTDVGDQIINGMHHADSRGATYSAPIGLREERPIRTPAPIATGRPSVGRARRAARQCICRIDSLSSRSDSWIADRIASVFAAIKEAFCFDVSPSSAMATDRAEADRFSICDEATDSERSRMAANGAISLPISASNRAISLEASSAAAETDRAGA